MAFVRTQAAANLKALLDATFQAATLQWDFVRAVLQAPTTQFPSGTCGCSFPKLVASQAWRNEEQEWALLKC